MSSLQERYSAHVQRMSMSLPMSSLQERYRAYVQRMSMSLPRCDRDIYTACQYCKRIHTPETCPGCGAPRVEMTSGVEQLAGGINALKNIIGINDENADKLKRCCGKEDEFFLV